MNNNINVNIMSMINCKVIYDFITLIHSYRKVRELTINADYLNIELSVFKQLYSYYKNNQIRSIHSRVGDTWI